MSRIAFFGLGLMGAPIARRLVDAGHEVRILGTRSRAAVKELSAAGATAYGSIADAASGANVIVTCLPNGAAVRSVLFEDGDAVRCAADRALLIDLSTIGVEASRELATSAAHAGRRYVDAPMSGGPAGAGAGTLTIFLAGDDADLAEATELCRAFAANVVPMGRAGQGQVAKLCNNLLVATCMLGNAQALALASRNGLDVHALVPVLLNASGANWQLANIVPQTILNNDYAARFSLANLVKDAHLIEDALGDVSVAAPSFTAAVLAYEGALEQFGAESDFSSVYRLLTRS